MTDISIDDMIAARTEARPDFKKGGQPRAWAPNRDDFISDAGHDVYTGYYGEGTTEPIPQEIQDEIDEAVEHAAKDPRVAIKAAKAKKDALDEDASKDLHKENAVRMNREDVDQSKIGADKPRAADGEVITDESGYFQSQKGAAERGKAVVSEPSPNDPATSNKSYYGEESPYLQDMMDELMAKYDLTPDAAYNIASRQIYGNSDKPLFKSEGADIDAKIFSNQFEKGGQPVTRFEGTPVIADYLAADAAVGEMDGNEDLPKYALFDKDVYDGTYKQAINDPKVALEAYRNKQAALEADAENDEFRQEDRLPDNFTSHRFPEHKENLPGAARPDIDKKIAERQ